MRAPTAGVAALLLLLLAVGAADAELRLRSYVAGFGVPVAIVQDPTDPTVQLVVEQLGRIRVVKNGALLPTSFLDLQGKIAFGGERGLFSIAFPPDAVTSGRFFVNFTRPDGGLVVARFRRSTDPLVADPASRFDLVWPDGNAFIAHPNSNHNGGHMVFGPDGYLYIGTGDGGAGDDPPHNAQNPLKLLGKLLRIDVAVPDGHPTGYVVPADNPFVGGVLPGTSTPVLTEIWAFGLRNPWRFNFDDVALGGSGALLIGDVGQGQWEEVDYQPPGAGGRNYGWRNREGKHAHIAFPPPAYTPLIDPIHEYDHGPGGSASITGGYVYRGAALGAEFRGRYFFADFVVKRVWSIALVVDPDTGEAQATDLREHTAELGGAAVIGNVSSFGVDGAGELYLVSYGAGAILRFALSGPADLMVSAVSAPATGIPGKTLAIPNTVKNVGDQLATGPFHVDIYLSATDQAPGAGTLVGSRNVSALAAGAMSAATTVVTVPPTAPAGLYYVSAIVDADNAVAESIENNNGLTAQTRVAVLRPDLMMQAVTTPARGVVGKTITVGTAVKNVGPAAAGPFTLGIYLSSSNVPGSGSRLALRNVSGLGPNATLALSGTVQIPDGTPPGTYFVSAVADDGRAVLEADDAADGTNGSNNAALAAAAIQIVPFLPDLEIAALSAPAAMAPGRPLTVSFTARNSGPAAATPFTVRFYLAPVSPPPAPGDGVAVGVKTLTGLGAGASLSTTATLSVPGDLSENAYYLSAVADADAQLAEVTEGVGSNGRVMATPIAVVRPDLRIMRLEASVPPATARAARGGTLLVRNVTVRNAALAPGAAGPFTLKFYLSDDGLLDPGDVELAAAPRSAGLAPGASWTIAPTLTIPPSVTTGSKFLIARADALDELSEADEGNNTLAIPVEIGDFVDLAITAVSGPAAAATARPMTAAFTVRNAGTAPAGPFRVSVFLAPGGDPTAGAGIELGSRDIAGLGAGAAVAGSLVVMVPADFPHGPSSLSAVADTLNAIPELGGNDSALLNGRVAARPINVVRPDLQVFRLTGPARAGRGGTATVSAIVRNGALAPGTAPASMLKFYLSNDDTLDPLDVELGPARAIPALGPGATSTATATLAIPATAPLGAAFILARADALDTVVESDEANNVAALPLEVGDFVNLTLTGLSGPASVKAGAAMTVSVTARNAGSVPAGLFRITLYLGPPPSPGSVPGDGIAVGFKDIPALGAGASVATSVVVTVPPNVAPGLYALSAVADADNAIPEAGGADGAVANGRVAARAVGVLAP